MGSIIFRKMHDAPQPPSTSATYAPFIFAQIELPFANSVLLILIHARKKFFTTRAIGGLFTLNKAAVELR